MITYTEDMKIGVPLVDAQHKSLVDFVNRARFVDGAPPTEKEMKESLAFLGDYVVRHFQDEEKLQVESRYSRYRKHRDIHQEFIRTFGSMYAEYEKYGHSRELYETLVDRASDWIVTHIMKEDAMFGKHYANAKMDSLKRNI